MASNLEQFKPQPGGIGQAAVRLNGGPQLGKTFALAAAPMGVQPQNGMASAPPMVQQPVHMQSPISSPQAPKGAQPVALVGQSSPMGGQNQQTQPMPMSPPPRPAMGQNQAPSPYLTKTPPQQQGNIEVHTISVVGLGSDGKKYLAEFDAVFPIGTKIEEVSERMGS